MVHNESTVPYKSPEELCSEFGDAFRFLALLCWPGNERRQKEAVATWAATLMGFWEKLIDDFPALVDIGLKRLADDLGLTPEELRAMPRIQQVLAEMSSSAGKREIKEVIEEAKGDLNRHAFAPAGGFLSVAAAPGLDILLKEQKKAAKGPEAVCGKILLVLAAAERHHAQDLASVSLNRVMWALEEAGQTNKDIPSVRWMKDAWAKTRGAHLWAGFWVACTYARQIAQSLADALESDLMRPENRQQVLGYAAWFKEWGETYTPKGAAHPLFHRRPLVPVQVPPLEPPLLPLPAELLRRLAAYRAPKDL